MKNLQKRLQQTLVVFLELLYKKKSFINTNLDPGNHQPSIIVFNNNGNYNICEAFTFKVDHSQYFSGCHFRRRRVHSFIQLAACKISCFCHSSCQKSLFPYFTRSATCKIFCFYHRDRKILLVFYSENISFSFQEYTCTLMKYSHRTPGSIFVAMITL